MKTTFQLSLALLALGAFNGGAGAWAQVAAPAARRPTPPPAAKATQFTDWTRVDQLLRQYTTVSIGRGIIGKVLPDGNVSYRDDTRVPGAIALVMRDGKVIYRKAFGVDDVGAQTPLRPDAIVRIASQTKAVTSVGAMLLYEEGKFQLDDPISKYLPAFRNPKVLATFNAQDSTYTTTPATSEITIRQLLTHTSGISYPIIGTKEARAIYAKAGIPSGIGTPAGSLAQSMDKLGALPLLHEPGAQWTYGLSVDVLGRLIEVLAGQPLDQFLSRRLFAPLGMKDTYFYLPATKRGRLAQLYTESADHKTAPMRPQDGMSPDYPKAAGTYFSGGAGLSSTIGDYAAFLEMLRQGGTHGGRRLLKAETVALMTENQIGALSQGTNKFGLGFSLTTAQSARPPGLSPGSFEWGGIFGTTYWVDPKEKLVALIYTQKYPNTTGNDLDDKFKVAVYEALAK
ncbi:serine hydrolase domain-containing protein [uncultured Hymenobacter sp.]|uniref:serine hydrolase domain-containing protein n=1 Tax=uncultured Hymenobacter sp. TaxID=170016 RepID=UPI0035CA62EE